MKRFAIIAAVCCLWAGGCTEEQRQDLDRAADDIHNSLPAAQQLADSPAGGLAGEKTQGYMTLGIGIAGALAAAWQSVRRSQAESAVKGVIASVDTLLVSDLVASTKRAKAVLADDQGKTLAAKVKQIKES